MEKSSSLNNSFLARSWPLFFFPSSHNQVPRMRRHHFDLSLPPARPPPFPSHVIIHSPLPAKVQLRHELVGLPTILGNNDGLSKHIGRHDSRFLKGQVFGSSGGGGVFGGYFSSFLVLFFFLFSILFPFFFLSFFSFHVPLFEPCVYGV